VKGRLKADSSYQCRKCRIHGTTIEDAVGKKEKLLLECYESVDCVEEFCCLGDMLSCGGGAEDASRVRVRRAWTKFRELSPILTSIGHLLS
jgi:hypothetical protein